MKQSGQTGLQPGVWIWLSFGWLAIIVKCLSVPWAVAYWDIPIKPFWVVMPTLVFAVVITALVLARFTRGEPKG